MRFPLDNLALCQQQIRAVGPVAQTVVMLAIVLGVLAPSPRIQAQTLTTLHNFACGPTSCAGGYYPQSGLLQGMDGEIYGTTAGGGAKRNGTIFKITPNGMLMTFYSFCSLAKCADGSGPQGGLVQGTSGYLYGTTAGGGAYSDIYGGGSVFKITPSGTLTTVHSFCSPSPTNGCTGGWLPYAGVVLGTNGEVYGTTEYGGPLDEGTVFRINSNGTATTLHAFCSQTECLDGYIPRARLVEASNGEYYGTTSFGGTYGGGTVYKITAGGVLTTVHNFCAGSGCTNAQPDAGLIQAADGNLYGTTSGFGAGGAVFRITPGGTYSIVYAFCTQPGCTGGSYPNSELVQTTDGNIYGTTYFGGSKGVGTIFQITPSGTLTTVYSFCNCADGEYPGSLMQDTNGDLYGTTRAGGAYGGGTVFRLNVGLGPFIKTLPASGTAGANITIFGSDLTGATSVTFNGTPATFTVSSTTTITAVVPTGAATGTVEVTTPRNLLSSNVTFRVTQ